MDIHRRWLGNIRRFGTMQVVLDGADEKLRLAPSLLVENINGLPVRRVGRIELNGELVLSFFSGIGLSSKPGGAVQQLIAFCVSESSSTKAASFP